MFRSINLIHKRSISIFLCLCLIATNVFPGLGSTAIVHAAMETKEKVDGTTISQPEQGESYYFDFLQNESLNTAEAGNYGLLTLSDGIVQNSHGAGFTNGTSLTLKVNGNVKISLGYCAYNSEGNPFTVTTDGTGNVSQLPTYPAKNTFKCYEQSGKMYSFKYFNDDNDSHAITIAFNETCYLPYVTVEPVNDTTVTGIPEKDQVYKYDFTASASEVVVPTSFTKENPIGTLESRDELLLINGNNTMYSHADDHGLVVQTGQSFEVKVAGNAYISFTGCKYSGDASVQVTAGLENGQITKNQLGLRTVNEGESVTFGYAGEATTLRFDVNGTGYLHGITVKNTTDTVDVKQWANKDFKIRIGSTEVEVIGADLEESNSVVTLSEGVVYQNTSKSAYISIPLNGRKLSKVAIENESVDTVEKIDVNEAGELVVLMKDQDTYPSSYTIKIQDSSLFKTPFVTDVETYAFTSGVVPNLFTIESPIENRFTTDNGILSFGSETGKTGTYYHSEFHGIAMKSKDYIDVKVAGDAMINFVLCQYGKEGKLTVTNLADGGTGSFDSNEVNAATCGDSITYAYTGNATTLRFTLDSTGETYLHGLTVKNTGKIAASDVKQEQPVMPVETGDSNTFTLTPSGQRLYANHSNPEAGMSALDQLGYYLFESTQETCVLEADVTINAMGASSNSGVFAGIFNADGAISEIATLAIRGDKKVRNVYSKPDQDAPAAGGINTAYSMDEVMHLLVRKEKDGIYTSVTKGGVTSTNVLKYSKCPLFTDGQNTNVRFGFGFSNVNAVLTNVVYKDGQGTILYNQNNCYSAIGNAPVVEEISEFEVSSDRTSVTVEWIGENCIDDGAYKVELSTDGGETYRVLGEQVRVKSYTTPVIESGMYKFRITGVCGGNEANAIETEIKEIIAPLKMPVVSVESRNGGIYIHWTESEGATEYEIYRKSSEEDEYSMIVSTSETNYIDEPLENETPFYYYIIAKNENNCSNPSKEVLSLPSAGHFGYYEHGEDACNITISQKSNDTVYSNTAVLAGTIDKNGTLVLSVNEQEQNSIKLEADDTFSVEALLTEGRNDVTLYVTDELGKITRKSFNFVYLTNYDMIVDGSYTGEDGAALADHDSITQYKTVQAAVNSVPADNKERKTILVKAGDYREHLVVTSPYITLIGEDRETVNINFYDAEESPVGGDTSKRCSTYVTSSATGFSAENLTFENTYDYKGDGSISNESADALRVDADRSTFINVKMLGYQDTLDASSNHQYYYKCYISGNIDYIYGSAQALFEDCDLVYRYSSAKNAGYIAAPKTSPEESYGYIFANCRVTAEEECYGSAYLLARPWGPDGATAFINCYMSGIVNKDKAYSDMSGNLAEAARFFEYYTYGEGFEINNRRPQLSKNQAETMLTVSSLGWDPYQAIMETNLIGSIITD